MAKSKLRNLPDLSGLAVPGAVIQIKATPKAAQGRVVDEGVKVRISVTAAPENGKANQSVRTILAQCMGVAPSTLILKQGQTSRDKVFVYEP